MLLLCRRPCHTYLTDRLLVSGTCLFSTSVFALRRKSEEKETVHKTDLFVSGSGLGLSAAVEQGKGKGMCWLAPTSNACQDAMDVVVRELGGAGGGARVIELASKSDAASPGFTWHSQANS